MGNGIQKQTESDIEIKTESEIMNKTNRQDESGINVELIWEQLMKSNPGPDNKQLCHLVIHSEPLAEKALEQLFKQHPRKSELYTIMKDAKIEFKKKAFEQMLVQGDNVYKYVVSTVIQIPELREIAWENFIELGPGGNELRLIEEYTESLKGECWKIIITQQISNDELIHLMEDDEGLREAAWTKLIQRGHTNRELCRIIEHVKDLRQKAWGALMKAGATSAELHYLIDHVPAVRQIAEYKLYKETEDIMKILSGLN